MKYLDPTVTRLSDTLLLSDVMGCDSVYRRGFSNRFEAKEKEKLAEGRNLGRFMDELHQEYGHFSVAYGYISPDLSRKIVRYQSPDKPSYHRWDLGAALDARFSEWITENAPIEMVHLVDSEHDYSRIITYSESEWVCFGTKLAENKEKPRKALYENRYIGVRKPKFVKYSDNQVKRREQVESHVLEHPWQGKGWPSYHGGGRRQVEHIPISRYLNMGDLLYDRNLVHEGKKNMPHMRNKETYRRWKMCANMAGEIYDSLIDLTDYRFSITKAFNKYNSDQAYSDRFVMELVPSIGVDACDSASYLEQLDGVACVQITKDKEPRIRITGEWL